MALTLTQLDAEGITIVDLKGRLTFGPEDLLFRSLIDEAVEAGKIRIALNLARLDRIDAVGLGSFIFALSRLRNAGGGLALFNLRAAHMDIVLVAKLEAVLGTFATRQDAINSFFPNRQVKRYDILEFVNAERAAKYGRLPRVPAEAVAE